MKKLGIALSIVALATMLGCSGSGNGGGGGGQGGISVSITPSGTTSVGVTMTQQFTAMVSGTSNTAVTWSVAGSGCSGAACGTISSSGLYTAPASLPNPQTVTVTATSAADTTVSANATVKVINITVGIAPATAIVALNGTQQFSAQVTPSSAVTWSVSGAGCSGNACGTVSSSGLYKAPASLPSPATVTVTATSSVQSTSTGKATVTLVTAPFTGQYAFRFSGSDANGPVYAAGIFSSDGMGHITAGVEDVNRTTGVSNLSFTGTYTLGTDNRGQMIFTAGGVTSTYDFAVGSSGEALFVELDNTGTRGGGIMDSANSSAFQLGKITGPYVMNLFGTNASGNRVGAAGLFVSDGAGNLTSGSFDLNDAGTAHSNLTVTGTYSVTSSGRGTIAASIQSLGTANYAFYIVSVNELFMVSLDPVSASTPRVVGLILNQDQNITYSNSTWTGSSVFNLTGLQAAGSVVTVGEITATPSNGTLSGMFDENNAGSISGAGAALSGTYTIGATGRGTISLTSANPPASSFVIYAFGSNAASILDMSSTNVLSGNLEPQTPGAAGVFSASTLQGTFVNGTTTASDSNATDFSGVLSIDGIGALTGTEDQSTPTTNTMGAAVAGTYTVASSGRGTATLTMPSPQQQVFYIVNPSKFVAIGVDAGNKNAAVTVAAR